MIIKCLCGRTTNYGISCSVCTKDDPLHSKEIEEIDIFDLVDEEDHEKLKEILKNSRLSQ